MESSVMRAWWSAVGLAFVLVAVVSLARPAIVAAGEPTHVKITGPRSGWHPHPRLLLEIGDKERVITGSLVVRVETNLPTTVVIRDLSDCRALFSFTARDRGPSAGYWVTVDAARRFQVKAVPGFTEGPYWPGLSSNRCPDLPDTSTASPETPSSVRAVASLLDRLLAAIDRVF